jgi:periplasmic divalent cation tolerance protein
MTSPTECILVLTTLPAAHDAASLARALVEERLAACVNILAEMRSVYRWQGAVEQETERQVLIKTTHHRAAALERRLRELHPYELPEVIVLPIVDGSEAYLRWVRESVGVVGADA